MPLRIDIQRAQMDALKGGHTALVSTLRMLWSGIRGQEIDERRELGDAEIQAVVARQVKQLRDALRDYESGGRTDLVEKALAEIRILEAYLPAQMDDAELEIIVRRVLVEGGITEQKDVGKTMGAVMKVVSGRADGNRVRAIVSRILSSSEPAAS